MNHVDPVGEEVCHLTATVVEIGAEVEVLLGIVIAPLQGAEEAGPVEIAGLLLKHLRGLAQVVAVAVPPGAGEGDLAELAGIEILFLGLQVVAAGTLLHAHLADAVVDAGGLDDFGAFFDGEREGLFYVDVFTGAQCINSAAGMPVVWRRDQDCVDILLFEKFAVVDVALGIGISGDGLVEFVAPDFGNGSDVHLLGVVKGFADVGAAIACSNPAEIDSVIGAQDPRIGCGGEGGGSLATKAE